MQLQRAPAAAGLSCRHHHSSPAACFALRPPAAQSRRRALTCRAGGADKEPSSSKDEKQTEYVEALKRGGIDQKVATKVLEKWREAGADGADPSALRKLFVRQSLVPITATMVQLLFDCGAAYSIFMTAGYLSIGPDFFGRVPLVFLLDFLSLYFAVGCVADAVTLVSVLITTAKLGTAPLAFYDAVKAIAASQGSAAEGLKVIEKAKAAVNAVKVAQALDAIAAMLDASGGAAAGAAAEGGGKATKSVDTLTNLSAYLTLYRAETQGGFDPASVGMSEKAAADIALKFGQYDLNDDGKLDSAEFVKMLQALGADVSKDEADAAMEVMDSNKDGLVTFDEFARWWSKRKTPAGAAAAKV